MHEFLLHHTSDTSQQSDEASFPPTLAPLIHAPMHNDTTAVAVEAGEVAAAVIEQTAKRIPGQELDTICKGKASGPACPHRAEAGEVEKRVGDDADVIMQREEQERWDRSGAIIASLRDQVKGLQVH